MYHQDNAFNQEELSDKKNFQSNMSPSEIK